MNFTVNDLISVIIIYQTLVFVFILLLNKKSKPLFVKVLAVICVLIAVHFGYMLSERFYVNQSIVFGPFFGLIYGPIYYMYSKSLTNENINLKRERTHFIPALVVLFCLIFFNAHVKTIFSLVEIIVPLHFIIYLGITLKLIYNYRKNLKNIVSSFDKITLFWLELIIYIQFIVIAFTLIESYFQSFGVTNTLITVIYILVLILINCFYFLGLKQVNLFEGLKAENVMSTSTTEYKISEELLKSYVSKIDVYINEKQPYLEFNLSLNDMSKYLSISTRNLSYVINKAYGKSFYDFINSHRLLLTKEGLQNTNKPIKEVMYDSGFSNKATFNTIFKKNTGLTPTQFRQKNKS